MNPKPAAVYRVYMTVEATYDYDLEIFREVVARGVEQTADLKVTLLDCWKTPAGGGGKTR